MPRPKTSAWRFRLARERHRVAEDIREDDRKAATGIKYPLKMGRFNRLNAEEELAELDEILELIG